MFELLALAFLFGSAGGNSRPNRPARKTPMFLRGFNAFQLVTLFSALPYIIGWLYTGPFPFSIAALVTAIAAYVILFGWQVFATAESFGS